MARYSNESDIILHMGSDIILTRTTSHVHVVLMLAVVEAPVAACTMSDEQFVTLTLDIGQPNLAIWISRILMTRLA